MTCFSCFKQTKFLLAALVCAVAVVVASPASAGLTVAGALQTEQGDASDWDPTGSSLIMSDLGGGIYQVTANNLLLATPYDFKIVDDEGTPPAEWGNPELTPHQLTVWGDADGSISIWVDSNTLTDNQATPGQHVTWINFDSGPLQVVGDFMEEAGGAGNWNPDDDAFDMTPQGNGYYTYEAVIRTPGIYQFKATYGMGWDDQIGTDGFYNNATTMGFETTVPNQQITMFVDLGTRTLGVITVPEPTSVLLLCGLGFASLTHRRGNRSV